MAPKRPPKNLGPLSYAKFREYVRFTGGQKCIVYFQVLDLDGSGEITKKE